MGYPPGLTLDIRPGAKGVDTASTIAGNDMRVLKALAYNGFTSRYVSAPFVPNQYKVVKDSEIAWHVEYGTPLLLNYERYTRKDSADSGNPNPMASWEITGSGVQDAQWCIAKLASINYPLGWPIPASIDDSMRGAVGSADYQRARAYWVKEFFPTIKADGRWWWGAYSGGYITFADPAQGIGPLPTL